MISEFIVVVEGGRRMLSILVFGFKSLGGMCRSGCVSTISISSGEGTAKVRRFEAGLLGRIYRSVSVSGGTISSGSLGSICRLEGLSSVSTSSGVEGTLKIRGSGYGSMDRICRSVSVSRISTSSGVGGTLTISGSGSGSLGSICRSARFSRVSTSSDGSGIPMMGDRGRGTMERGTGLGTVASVVSEKAAEFVV